MKRLIAIVLALFCMPFVSSQLAYSGIFGDIDQIISPLKSITKFDGYVLIKGRWKKISSTSKAKGNKPPKINTVHIVCDKESMSCWETIAELATPQDVGFGDQTFLHINQTGYKILEWSQDHIYAENTEHRVSDFELRILLRNDYAERFRKETTARGCGTCDPSIFEHWIIE